MIDASSTARSDTPPDADEAADRKTVVRSFSKGLRVLEAVARSDEPLTLSEISRGSGVDAGTCFRMLNTLVEDGYLQRLEGKRFGLTLKVLDLGHRAIARRDLRGLVRPLLRSLVSETSEAASFAVLEGNRVLYIERVRAGFARLGVDVQIGTTVSAHNSVVGLAILAFLSPERLSTAKDAIAHTEGVMFDRTFDDRLQAIRDQGYHLAPSLVQSGLLVLAAPVLDADRFPIGAVSVVAPSTRTSVQAFEQSVVKPLLETVSYIARGLEAGGQISM